MGQLASDTCTDRRVTCILNRIGWQWGCIEGVSVSVSDHSSGTVSSSRYFAAA